MSLKSEIAALRATAAGFQATGTGARADPEAASDPASSVPLSIETLIAAAGETVVDIEADIKAYPHLAALAAFGLGICLGLALRAK